MKLEVLKRHDKELNAKLAAMLDEKDELLAVPHKERGRKQLTRLKFLGTYIPKLQRRIVSGVWE